jgi:pimeloyl-ACP methyl ester carboxylesterase
MPITTAGPVPIHYSDLGCSDPTLLLMPGWCADRGMFARVQVPLSAWHRVLALDWRGHGASAPVVDDFGHEALVEDALAVIEHSAAGAVVPVAVAHAGWVAIGLRRRLGDRVAGIVLVDWIVGEPPAPFRAALHDLQVTESRGATVRSLTASWAGDSADPDVLRLLQRMREQDPDMWSRGAREIFTSYQRMGTPLKALAALSPPVPTLHLYAQPPDDSYLEMQRAFAEAHPWFHVERLTAKTHFPHIDEPEVTAEAVDWFVRSLGTSAAAA